MILFHQDKKFETSKKKSKSKKYVDLSLDNLYDDSETKICQNCGEKNRKDALTCYKCGAKIGEEDDKKKREAGEKHNLMVILKSLLKKQKIIL